jgi:hypothetical protein
MKDSTLAKITASVAVAKGMAQKALAASPNPQWTEYEMQSVDEWIARQDVKRNRSEAIRRLVELGLKAKGKWTNNIGSIRRRNYRTTPRSKTFDFPHACGTCFGGLKTVGEVRETADKTLLSFQDLGPHSVTHLRKTLGLPSTDGVRPR